MLRGLFCKVTVVLRCSRKFFRALTDVIAPPCYALWHLVYVGLFKTNGEFPALTTRPAWSLIGLIIYFLMNQILS